MSDRPLIDARFHDTYRLAGFVRGVLESPYAGHLHLVSDIFADDGCTETFAAPYRKVTSVHHIVPLAKGGQNDLTNVQLLCASCNLAKGDRTVTTLSIYDSWVPTATPTSLEL